MDHISSWIGLRLIVGSKCARFKHILFHKQIRQKGGIYGDSDDRGMLGWE